MKKSLALILACVLVFSAFAAFAEDKTPTDPKPESIEISYSYTGALNADEYLARFEKQFEETYGIKLKVNKYASAFEDIDVIKTAVASGTGPDMWHMDVNYFSAFKDTVIQPIDPYLDDSIFGEYLDNGIGMWKSDDHFYALPVSFSVVGFLYNKDAAAAAGVTLGDTWTFEEFEKALATCYDYYKDKKITYSDGKEYPYWMLTTQHTMYYWWLFYGVYGGTPMYKTNNIAQEAFVNAIVKMAEWRAKGYLHYSGEVGPVSTSVAFANGANVLFWPTGDWTISTLTQQELGINTEALPMNVNYASIPAPLGQDGKPHTEIYNQGIVLNKATTGWKAKACAELIKFMVYDDDNWFNLFGPGDAHNYCMPGKKSWSEKYATDWINNLDHAKGFLYTLSNGVCNRPDYNNDNIDVTTMTTGVIMDAFNFVDAAGSFNEADVRKLVTEKLEAQQALYNIQLEENDRELDNPDAKVK